MSTTSNDCNDDTSKSNDDCVCEMLQNMSTEDKNCTGISHTCANCGKEGSDVNNTCNKCKIVMYCNAACKKKHRHKHKRDCEEHQSLAAEHAAKLHDEDLFKQPPTLDEDCPICFLRMPILDTGKRYKSCCGKVICSGCIHAVRMRDGDVGLCPFCRAAAIVTDEEAVESINKQVYFGDALAISILGGYYAQATYGLPRDYAKALELWHKAAELGYAGAQFNLGVTYDNGRGVEIDKKKAIHYWELAAMMGDTKARHTLGNREMKAGIDRAIKHYMIAVKGGEKSSVDTIQLLYKNGHATKEDYTKALQAYQEYLNEVKSVQRDEAASHDNDYKYY